MDALSGERGQAVILAVFALALAALAIGGLRVAQERILADHVERRAYEAAVEGAAAVLADAYAAGRDARDGGVVERARLVAADLSRRNGGGAIERIDVTCGERWTEVTVVARGRTYRAGIEAACSPR